VENPRPTRANQPPAPSAPALASAGASVATPDGARAVEATADPSRENGPTAETPAEPEDSPRRTGITRGPMLIVLVFIGIAAAVVLLSQNAQPTADDYIRHGVDRAEKSHDLAGALDDFNQALAIDPNNAQAYNSRGLVKADMGDLAGAVEDYDAAIRLDPKLDQAFYNRGRARRALGDPQGAVQDFTEVVRLAPAPSNDFRGAARVASLLADTYMNRGNAYSDLGDYQAAINDFNEALRNRPNSAEVFNNLGLAMFKQGDAANAITQYSEAIRYKPDLAQAHMNRGLARASLGDRDAALQDLQIAAALFQSQGNAEAGQQVLQLAQGVQQQ